MAAGPVNVDWLDSLHGVALLLGVALGVGGVVWRERRRRRHAGTPAERILLPCTGGAISIPALDAALRLARAENATLVPAYVATVPLTLALDAAVPVQGELATAMLDAIEQRASLAGVDVDSRVERGRTIRDGLRRLIDEEDFGRVLVPVSTREDVGLSGADITWILESVPAEVVAFRAGPDEELLHANGRDRARRSHDSP